MLRKVLSDEASSRFGAFASAGSEDSSSAQSSLIRTTREGRMVYAEAHDENVAEDYFAAMERVEARLDLRGGPEKQVLLNGDQRRELLGLAEKLAVLELCEEKRVELAGQLQAVLLLNG